jgi:putative endonuclease
VTNDLLRRVSEHREKQVAGFTARYNVSKLVYFEIAANPEAAITREKQLKDRSRKHKLELIARQNPEWRDLFDDLRAE